MLLGYGKLSAGTVDLFSPGDATGAGSVYIGIFNSRKRLVRQVDALIQKETI